MDEADAATWAVRIDAGPLDPHVQNDLDAWLEKSPRHVGELLRAQAMLSYVDRGRALDAEYGVETEGVSTGWRVGRRRLIAGAGSALAASLLGAALVFPRGRSLRTSIGEVRQVPLADGSVAMLNTATLVRVKYVDAQRMIRLDGGEAWFRVAPDKVRPFVVEAGDIRVRAVGTAFSVRRRDSGVDVLVTEGVVETWIAGQEAAAKRVAAGSRAFISDRQAHIDVTDGREAIDRALAWRSGELALDGETLAYAVEEINRYNVRQIRFADPSIGREQIAGYFRTTEPENFGRAVASMVGGRVVVQDDVILVERGQGS